MSNNSSQSQLQKACALVLLLASVLALSCSRRSGDVVRKNIEGTAIREVTDELGRRVRVPVPLKRIVTLAPNLTEIVYAVGAGDKLVGNTTYCDYPEQAKRVAKVSDTLHPNIEQIVALHPQLIFVSTASQLEAFTRQLDEQGIAVYITDPRDLEGVFRSINAMGELLDQHERAEQLVQDLRSRVSHVERIVASSKPVRVFMQFSDKPLYTAGRDAFVTDMIRRAGGVSVTAEVPGAWPRLSDETALASRPEAIIMAADNSTGRQEVAEALRKSPAAVKGRVYAINGDFLSRPGPRLVEGIEQIARVLHPENFK